MRALDELRVRVPELVALLEPWFYKRGFAFPSNTREFVWICRPPEVDDIGQVRIDWDCTVVRFHGNIQGGTSCTVNVEERSTLGTSGVDILSSDMVADADGEDVTSGFNNDSLLAGNYLTLDISAVSGSVDKLTVCVVVEV